MVTQKQLLYVCLHVVLHPECSGCVVYNPCAIMAMPQGLRVQPYPKLSIPMQLARITARTGRLHREAWPITAH